MRGRVRTAWAAPNDREGSFLRSRRGRGHVRIESGRHDRRNRQSRYGSR